MSDPRPAAEPWPDPTAVPDQEKPPARPAARNYLARPEQRRVFWLVMPPALIAMLVLGWVERSWFGRPSAVDRPQIDTKMAEIPPDSAVADAVVIEADAHLPAAAGDGYGASPEALARVRDDTVFRGAETEAWFQIWLTLRSDTMQSLARAPASRVSFTELFGQPRSHRGRLVRFRGTLHRLEKVMAPANDKGIEEYWQGWLEPEGGPVSPIVVYFLRLPDGMPHGMAIDEPVEVVGSFFKRWAYAATDTVRIAPVVLALEPIWKPRPTGSRMGDSIGSIGLLTMAAVVLLTVVGIRVAGHGPGRGQPPAPTDLTSSLAASERFSTEEGLRRLEEAARVPTSSVTKEPLP